MVSHCSSYLARLSGVLLLTLLFTYAARGQAITQVFAFACVGQSCPNGGIPAAIIQASDGNFYGTALFTRRANSVEHGGTIFRLTASGHFTLLFSFTAGTDNNFPNGDFPSSLVEGRDGFLYGTAVAGGAHGQGTFFKISTAGTGFKVLHNFCAQTNCNDGALPIAIGLGPDGNFYGTSTKGGVTAIGSSCFPSGCGTIFRIAPSGAFNLIHALNGTTDGTNPSALIVAPDGNFYGLSIAPGLLFRVSTSGQYTAVQPLTFANRNTVVQSGLVEANGKLYGVACHYLLRQRVLFEINLDGGNLQTLAPFEHCIAELPFASLLSASDGNLWVGSVQQPALLPAALTALSPNSGFVVKSFSFNGVNGSGPINALIQAKDGTLHGTTRAGGTVSNGTASGVIFSLSDALPPLP